MDTRDDKARFRIFKYVDKANCTLFVQFTILANFKLYVQLLLPGSIDDCSGGIDDCSVHKSVLNKSSITMKNPWHFYEFITRHYRRYIWPIDVKRLLSKNFGISFDNLNKVQAQNANHYITTSLQPTELQ